MKRAISITLTSVIIVALIAYCIFLITQKAIYVSPSFTSNEMIASVGLIIILAVVRFYSTIGGSRIDKPKLTLSALGVGLIFVGAYVFVDVAGTNTFLSDMTRIVGVYILIAGLAGFIGGGSTDTQNTSTGGAARRVKGAEVIEI